MSKPITLHIYRDDLGYTFNVREYPDGTAKWRKTIYKSLAHARRAINRWAEGGIEKIKQLPA